MDFKQFSQEMVLAYQSIVSLLPVSLQGFVNLFLVVVLMVLYSVFIWKLHKFIGKKNILKLNLNQYNNAEHPFVDKVFASVLYFVEYIVVFPLLIFFWFAVFTVFLVLVMELDIKVIIFISAATIASIRIASYIPEYGGDLAKELAKLIPLNLLAIALLTPGFFDVERVIENLSHLSNFFGIVINYLLLIVVLEILLRFFELVFSLYGIEDEDEEKEEEVRKRR